MKKALKITAITLGIVILLLALAPFLFKGSIEDLLRNSINRNVNATVNWEEMDLSLFSSFPDAAVSIKNFSVINKAPFASDTLVSGDLLKLNLGISELFKGSDESIQIDALQLGAAILNIKVDSLGNANYYIAVKNDAPVANDSENNEAFTFDLQHYEINDSEINYINETTRTYLHLSEVNHEGNGDFSAQQSQLDTKTEALASLRMENVDYLKDNNITLDALFQLDLENSKYTFLENEAKINELPLTFNGYIQVNENSNELDLTFKTPSSDFKNFLGVIPKVYVKELDGVTTTGNFTVNGMVKGIVDDQHIPQMDIKVRSDNASFKYPDLPKAVRNISISADLINETGLVQDTYLTIGGLTFKIDDRIFTASGSIRNLTQNALVNLALNGTLDLANIEQVLPIEMEQDLIGIFKADVNTNFDMNSVETEQYQNIKTIGTASLTNFTYVDAAFKNPLNISSAAIEMSPQNIQLTQLNATSGETDVQATGNIQNLIPWLLSKQDLKGRFNIQSDTFNVTDLLASEETSTEGNGGRSAQTEEAVALPDFLDATLNFTANKVIYDNLILENTTGSVALKDQTANLSNVTSNIFGGKVSLDGNISTKNSTPTFAMELDLNDIDIDQSFKELPFLKYLAPIAKALQGNMNTKLSLNGNLTNDLVPDLTTIAGNALASIVTAEVNPEQTPLLAALSSQLSFLKLDKLNLKDVSTVLTFENGNIQVQPFDFDVEGINVAVAGGHGLDKSMNYNVTMDVPARYLGSDVGTLLAKLDPEKAENMTVGLPIGLTGSFTNPKISLNTAAAVNTLTKKLLDEQKDDLIEQGTNILGDILGGNTTTINDSTQTDTPNSAETGTTEVVKDIIGDIFGKKEKKKDSVKGGN